jgi:TMEM175 potassium channel family protein
VGRSAEAAEGGLVVGPGRLESLIDGVFAIAVTLLVLDLPRPKSSTALGHDLSQQWPAYLAYLVSFVTIGLIWIEHHGMMSAVRTIDRRFLERTLAFLLFVSVIPWPTAIAAQYADRGFSQARTAAILYASTMLLMGLTFAWGWQYLAAHPEMVAAPARAAFPTGMRRALLGGSVYLVAIVAALISPALSFAIDALVAAYFALSRSQVPGLIHRAAQSEGTDTFS